LGPLLKIVLVVVLVVALDMEPSEYDDEHDPFELTLVIA
jgi:hypothetical protein